MALTAAERSKRYRDNKKKCTETHEAYLKKERERYQKRKEQGQYSYSGKSEREMNLIRRKWKTAKRNDREKKKQETAAVAFMENNTPTSSPATSPVRQVIENTHQKRSGKNRSRKNRKKTKCELKRLSDQKERFRKLWERSRKMIVRLKTIKTKHKIQKTAVCTNVKKQMPMMKKENKTRLRQLKAVRTFLEEDVNSTLAPGKKDTVTSRQIKKQKRFLNDTMLNLYKKFIETHPHEKMSYVTFSRLRPFWIVQKNVESRNTCLCKLHENIKLRIGKLSQLKVILDKDPDMVARSLVCEQFSKACAYGECKECKERTIRKNDEFEDDMMGQQISYHQWVNRAETINTKDGTRTVQKTVKQTEFSTAENLLKETTELMREKYIKHIYNVSHQYKVLKEKKDNITNSEAVIHVDFSENYNCKLSEEIQAMHFGGSRNQISLHTVVLYTHTKTESFCTVSENTYHGPAAIWAHLRPILSHLKENYPEVKTVHFVSDGPCTQYRSKNHFFLFDKEMMQLGFTSSTWNFTEAGHGKSAADGIGATVKRTADRIVAFGGDITNSLDFYNKVSKALQSVRLFHANNEDIDMYKSQIPKDLPTIKGTLKLHQVLLHKEQVGHLALKVLSCFCKWPDNCECYPGETPNYLFGTKKGIFVLTYARVCNDNM